MLTLSRRTFGISLAASAVASAARAETCPVPEWVEPMRRDLEAMAVKLTQRLKPWSGPKRVLTPEAFGHKPGALATTAIQKAIDACAAKGGGTVRLSRGDYTSGTIQLRDNIRLDIARSARLIGSLDLKDWPEHVAKRRTVQDTNMGMNQSLIFAEGLRNIALSGQGTIDGRGGQFKGEETIHGTPGRPFIIRVIDCKSVHVSGLTMTDSPCWMQNYLNCDDLLVEGLTVDSRVNWNNDGIDIDGCRNVIVRKCHILSGDDGICFKGASQAPAENILVEDCTVFSSCNALKLGTDSQSVFRNVLARRLTLGGLTDAVRSIKGTGAISGISWEVVDGGRAERIWATDITINNARSPLFMRNDDRGRVQPGEPKPAPGTLRQVLFDHIRGADNGPRGSFLIGIPARRIQDVVIRDVDLMQRASSKPAVDEATIPEMYNLYPDAEMLKDWGNEAPAYGLWARHVDGLTLIDFKVRTDAPDPRPFVLAKTDVSRLCGA